MSSFGFHGKVPDDSLSGKRKRTKKTDSAMNGPGGSKSQKLMNITPAINGMNNGMANMNMNQPMYNGMYNMPPIQPQPVNGSAGSGGSNRRMMRNNGNNNARNNNISGMMNGMNPMNPVNSMTPINSYTNSYTNGGGGGGNPNGGYPQPTVNQSAQDKIALWKSQRNNQNNPNNPNHPNNQMNNQMNNPSNSNGSNGANNSNHSNNIPNIPNLNVNANPNANLPQLNRASKPSGLGAIDIPSFDSLDAQINQSVTTVDHDKLTAHLTRLVDSCKTELAELKHALEVNGQLDPASTINNMQKHIQQMSVDHNTLKEHIRKLGILIQNQQLQFDERARQDEVRRQQNPAESLEQLSQSVNAQFQRLANEVREAVQKVSEQGHFIYGRALEDRVSIFDTPDSKSREVGTLNKDDKLLLNYPMLQRKDGVWMSGRTVGGDGQIVKGYVPLWVFPASIVDQFYPSQKEKLEAQVYDKIPPQYKQTYIGKFEL